MDNGRVSRALRKKMSAFLINIQTLYLYVQGWNLCHLVHSQIQPQSLLASSTGPGRHCTLPHGQGKLGLR